MSIASEITRINNAVASAYTAVSNKGGTLPQTQNVGNLATAIDTIETGGGSGGDISKIKKKLENILYGTGKYLRCVGGTVMYVNSSGDGTYTFYDSNLDVVSAPSIGSDYTNYFYTVENATIDKYYVFSPNAVFGANRTGTQSDPYLCWTYLDEANQSYIDNTTYNTAVTGKDYTYYGVQGRVLEEFDFQYSSSIENQPSDLSGFAYEGKRITNTIMGIERSVTIGGSASTTKAYIQSSQKHKRGSEDYCETIWYALDGFNKGTYSLFGNTTGCNDWYIPCMQELQAINFYFLNYSSQGALDSLNFFRQNTQEDRYSASCTPYPSNPIYRAFMLKNANSRFNVNRDGTNVGFQLVLMRSF